MAKSAKQTHAFQAWLQTGVGRAVLAVACLAITYLGASLAIDTGSLMAYTATLIFFLLSVRYIFLSARSLWR